MMTATAQLLGEVEDAMASGSLARRGKIVRHITDLFIVGSTQCSDQEIELFDDVLKFASILSVVVVHERRHGQLLGQLGGKR